MKRLIRVVMPIVLLAAIVITGACTSAQATQATKLEQIVVTDIPCVLEALYDGSTFFDRNATGLEKAAASFSILKECVPDAIKTYTIQVATDPSLPFPSSVVPYADVEYALDGTLHYPLENTYQPNPPLSVTTNVLSNCSSSLADGTLHLSIPFKVFVQGTSELSPHSYDETALQKLVGPTSDFDADLIAHKLYSDIMSRFHTPIIAAGRLVQFNYPITVPAKTTEAFTVTYTVSYRNGGALVSRQGKQGQTYAWLYADGLTITGATPYHARPVTASECP